jgi:murein DD-endopeptidase MepM/ murein hydrolase activator NlpD
VGTCIVAAALGVTVGALGVATADYLTLKGQATTLASMQQKVGEQTALIETFQKRIGDVRKEIATWKELHARMAEPFGPESGAPRSTAPAAGIGGGTGLVRPDPEGDQPIIWQEVEALAASVLDEGPRVRALERTVSSAGRMIAAMPSRWPVRGAVNSEFGRRKSPWGTVVEHHSGLDIAAGMGTPV